MNSGATGVGVRRSGGLEGLLRGVDLCAEAYVTEGGQVCEGLKAEGPAKHKGLEVRRTRCVSGQAGDH